MAKYKIWSMELVGRQLERRIFQNCLQSDSSRLIAVFGRRRIGKTFLVRRHFEGQMVFDVAGLHNGTMSDQLAHFKNTLQKAGFKEAIETPTSWMSAFNMLELFLNGQKSKKKKVVFFDELPWFDTPRSKFLMAFENFWNACCTQRNDLVVVICGSAASWMIKKILNNKGGLYNRVTEKINLQPFTLHETEAFLKAKGIGWSRYDMVQLFMITGGVPFYLDNIQKGESLMQFADRACFSPHGILVNEFEELFSSLFYNSHRHYSIIQALSKVKKGILRDELLALSGLSSGGGFTETLDELLASGFVKKYTPYQTHVNKSLYRISDFFTLFYIKFMQGSKASGEGTWLKKMTGQSWISWTGLAFENICMQHIRQIKEALKISVIYTEESAWKGGSESDQAQVDLVIERADRIIHLCEIKFAKGTFTIDKKYAAELRNSIQLFAAQADGKRKSILLTMLTTFGVADNEYKKELVHNDLTMDDLFTP